MIIELRIENFGIIENVRLRPGAHLNTITGETGSGKSLVLQAVDGLLGSRLGPGIVRNGCPRAALEGIFDIQKNSQVRSWLAENGFPDSDQYLSLRREIPVDGRGRCFVNGQPAGLNALRAIGGMLMEIHGQHEHQRLLDPESHLDALDIFAGLRQEREEVSRLFYSYNHLKKRLRSVNLEAGERKRRIDYLKYAINEIEEFEPEESEFEELSRMKAVIQNSGRYYSDVSFAFSGLKEEESSVIDLLTQMEHQLSFHTDIRPELEEPLGHLRESIYRLEMLGDFLRSEKEGTQYSPEQLEDIDDRIAEYKKLHKKYGGSTASMLSALKDFRHELSEMEMSDEEAEMLASEAAVRYSELLAASEDLSRKRSAKIPVLEEKLAAELSDLGMNGAAISISVKREVDPELSSDGRIAYSVNEKGLDRVEFMLRANLGEKIQPLRKVASGGELSRIMLAVKSIIIENNPVSTVVFDEVDTGVGGEVAHAIGARLRTIASKSQVLVVTHLHQIASLGDQHFRIAKEIKDGRTLTQLQRLQGEKRLEELTRMLGGGLVQSPAAVEHARELLARHVG